MAVNVTITEELETHPIFAGFVRQCGLMSIGKWDPEVYWNIPNNFVREPHTGYLVYLEHEPREYEISL